MEPLAIGYRFEVEGGTSAEFEVVLDPHTLLAQAPGGDLPSWTRLEFQQCPNCPLDPGAVQDCPAAAQLPRLVETFDHLFSYAKARVEVRTERRVIWQDTSIQQGIGTLMGLIMATSGCPLTSFFRPMARFHLPFADQEETTFRAASTYLLGDYLRASSQGSSMQGKLEGLSEIYTQVHEMNKAMAERLRVATTTDSSVNALIVLGMFAVILPFEVESHLSGMLENFQPFLDWAPGDR